MKIHPAFLAAAAGLSLGACGTSRNLPAYERPLAHTSLQNVRTTAYTDTEADHRQYGNLTALGSVLHPAPRPVVPRAVPLTDSGTGSDESNYRPVAYVARARRAPSYTYSNPAYGSAAADWSRWPAGTIFRIISTGQLYRVEDYGWALAGRNTIDLYMSTPRDMNGWGVRQELIQVVQWGDPQESLHRLVRHTKYRHIKRMVLELEGHERAAAHLH
ncbi:MAG: hypothetical protein ACRD5Z_06980 [Bryobacteraceae bacterium]